VIRPLVISSEQREAIDHLVNFAKQPDMWYVAGKSRWIPGDNPPYVLHVDTYRCVFTYTLVHDGSVYRHLSISVSGEDYPHLLVVFSIASMFGFTGGKDASGVVCTAPGDDWIVRINTNEHCIVVAQLILHPGRAEGDAP
jgi:hypothetical protein